MTHTTLVSVAGGAVAILAAAALVTSGRPPAHRAPAGAVRVAVLGDSDSHGYRDHRNGVRRGGDWHASTLQWTDVLARLRPDDFDLGPEADWGSRGVVARTRARLGLEARTPRKIDYRWNYAVSGAGCSSLHDHWPWQTRWLVSALRAEPSAWRDGIVVIRIGVNDLGQERHLDAYARDGVSTADEARIDRCVRDVRRAVRAARRAHTGVRIVVVGVADDSAWPVGVVPRRSAAEVERIRAALDRFDDRLEDAVTAVPGTVFLRDRRWYQDNWADRDAAGMAVLSARDLGGPVPVTNTRGDDPRHLSLADGHAGTVANGFFARELVRTVNAAFGMDVPLPTDAELARLADPDGRAGISAPAGVHHDQGSTSGAERPRSDPRTQP